MASNPALQTDKTPPDPVTLAEAIVRISDGMTKLLASGLNRRAVIAGCEA